MAFSGTFDNGFPVNPDTNEADAGWHICDGTHDTPDLRGKFILGASSNHTAGSAGGEETHVLTEGELPFIDGTWNTAVVGFHGMVGTEGHAYGTGWGKAKKHVVSQDDDGESYGYGYHFGDNQPHNNMPPYYALSYIMKI